MNRIVIAIVVSVFALSVSCKRKTGGAKDKDSVCPLGCLTQDLTLGGITQGFAMNDSYVFSCQGTSLSSDIVKASLDGITNTNVVHIASGCISVAADEASVYWFTTGEALMSAPASGGTATTLTSGYTGNRLAARDGALYWINAREIGGILSMPASGGTVTTLATGLAYPTRIAVDDTNVYAVTDRSNRKGPYDVVKVPIAGGTATTLATETAAVSGVVSDGTTIYWLTGVAGAVGSVMSVPVAGGEPVVIGRTGGPTAPQLGEDELVWGDAQAQGVVRLPLNGGTPSTVFADINLDSAFLTDGANSYVWAFVYSSPTGAEPPTTSFYKLKL